MVLALASVLLTPALALATPLPLDEAIRAAWTHNEGYAASARATDAARLDADAARDRRLPTLSLSAQGVRTDEPVAAFGMRLDQARITAADFAPERLNHPDAIGGYRLGATITQVLYGGGRVTAGTDAPINPYGLSLLMELENYASGGLTPVEVLRTATMASADAMGVGADIGSIESGKLADLTFIDGNTLENIADLKRVRRVMKDGNMYDVSSLIAGR